MKYSTYEISVVSKDALKFYEVVACEMEAAIADVQATYDGQAEIVSCRLM